MIINFKSEITQHRQNLLSFLLPHKDHRIPRFYGSPKIHKPTSSNVIPPIRPIVFHTNSFLSHSAQFLDHVLQPIARSYPDYLHYSTDLILKLSKLQIKQEITLISIDVISLYPSIPQTECLKTVYEEINHLNIY